MIPEESKKIFVAKYSSIGNEKFYKFLLNYAVNRIINSSDVGNSPEAELLDYYDKFLIMYRRERIPIYLEMAKVFRKAAHKIYRLLLKKEMISINNKFLNAVG